MYPKVFLIGLLTIFLGASALFFFTNSSYQDSIQARVFYFLEDYDLAHELSKKAYEKDVYNKMAFTVYTQSKIALKFVEYINQGNEYLKKIDAISEQEEVSEADRSRIKLMSEIMIESYFELSPSSLTDKKLVKKAKTMQERFVSLYKELFPDSKHLQ